MSELLQLFLLSFIGSMFGLVGGLLFLFSKRLSKLLEANAIPFAAGVLITVSLLGLLPEAVEMGGESAYLTVLISFFVAYFFEQMFIQLHHHDHEGHKFGGSVPMVILGDTIHNFIDGAAIGATFLVSPGLGLVTAISTFLHEIPHEVGDFGILLRAKWAKKNIVAVNLASATCTMVAAFWVYFMEVPDSFIAVLLAVSAGVFLYLGASDFLPHISEHKRNKMRAIVPLVFGILVMVFTLMAIPHSD